MELILFIGVVCTFLRNINMVQIHRNEIYRLYGFCAIEFFIFNRTAPKIKIYFLIQTAL